MERKVEIKELADQPIASVKFKTSLLKIGEDLGRVYGAIFALLGKAGEPPAGPAMAIYHDMEFRQDDITVEAAVPVRKLVEGEGEVASRVLPGGKVASTLHSGPYEETGVAYQELMLWISENGFIPVGACRELYLSGPQDTDDPSEYLTEIVCPVQNAG